VRQRRFAAAPLRSDLYVGERAYSQEDQMTTTRTMSLTPEIAKSDRNSARKARANRPLLLAAALLLAVLIADALLLAAAAPSVAELSSLYVTTT
jgi:hypothetical protein